MRRVGRQSKMFSCQGSCTCEMGSKGVVTPLVVCGKGFRGKPIERVAPERIFASFLFVKKGGARRIGE